MPILWQSFRISDTLSLQSLPDNISAKQWRHQFRDVISALTCNRRRASLVLSLEVILTGSQLKWSFYAASVMRDLKRALMSVPSLRRLKIRILHKNPQLIVPSLTTMLITSLFPFILVELECSSSLEPAIFPFIRLHPSIECYSVTTDLGYVWYEGRKAQALRALAYKGLLPALKHYCGPPAYARAMSLIRHLDSIEIRSNHAEYDIELLRPDLSRITSNWTANISSVALVFDEQGSYPQYIAANIVPLISMGYSIAITSVKHLKISQTSRQDSNVLPLPFIGFDPSVLNGLSRLETIEWTWLVLSRYSIPRRQWWVSFVRDCEVICPRLERISIMLGELRLIEFVRTRRQDVVLPGRDYTDRRQLSPSRLHDGNTALTTIDLQNGSIWTTQADFPLMSANDLFHDTGI